MYMMLIKLPLVNPVTGRVDYKIRFVSPSIIVLIPLYIDKSTQFMPLMYRIFTLYFASCNLRRHSFPLLIQLLLMGKDYFILPFSVSLTRPRSTSG